MKLSILIALMLSYFTLFSQINIPINEKELSDYNRERTIISAMNIDMAQTWLYMVKDNVVSKNKILIQKIYYNSNGLPNRINYYDENANLNYFTIINYNHKNLPLEEIKYNADSTLIEGILYKYERNGFLSSQIFYDNKANIIKLKNYSDNGKDTIVVTTLKNDSTLILKSIIEFNGSLKNGTVKKIKKFDINNHIIEETIFKYNEFDAIRNKITYDSNNLAVSKDFIYGENGELVRTISRNANGDIIHDSSFEYDDYGNLIKIIDYDPNDKLAKLFVINYYSKTE